MDRVQLADAIRKAYTFADTEEPAHVQHWETLANISEYLHPYTANFAKNCMKYRHIRFKRSSSDGKVWMQVAESMSSAATKDDEWRGLAPRSTHTIPFNTSFGIPNLWNDYIQNNIPASKSREFNEEEHNKIVTGCEDMHKFFDKFSNKSLDDCMGILQLYKDPPRPFPWSREEMKSLYMKGPGSGLGEDVVALQQAKGLPVGKVGEIYLCRPAEEKKKKKEKKNKNNTQQQDTFILGIIRALAKDKHGEGGVKMQWFQHAAGANKYESAYTSVLPSSTYNDKFPFAYDACLQYKMKGAHFKKHRTSGVVTSFKIHANELDDVKYYEARFANGPDLQVCPHELPLTLAAINRAGRRS